MRAMSATYQDTRDHMQRIAGGLSPKEIVRRLAPKRHEAPPRVPGATRTAVGVTRFEIDQNTDGLYAAVTLPNLIVGTVGGGTGLPSQRACLGVLQLAGAGQSRAFAEVCSAVALAGELSIIAALSAQAHARLARGRKPKVPSAGAPA